MSGVNDAQTYPKRASSPEDALAPTPEEISLELCWMDGFVTAVALSPVFVPPEEWVGELLGNELAASRRSDEMVSPGFDLMMGGYRNIRHLLDHVCVVVQPFDLILHQLVVAVLSAGGQEHGERQA